MKILLAHVVYKQGLDKWYQEISETSGEGLQVSCFPITITPPGPRLSWKQLNRRWKTKEKHLMDMYRKLQEEASHCDVMLLYNGANIHPEFLEYLPTFNVYCCFDDPESSEDLSAPVASAFDAVFYGNIASRFQYESWGCKKLAWLPVFTAPSDVPEKGEGESLLYSERDVDISIVCEKNIYRKKRLEMLVNAFPQANYFGKGWDSEWVDDVTLKRLYGRTKIGWNVHNSTGPINRRLFTLPAYGMLQICDNKTGLGQIFELNKEVIGFDTVPEAIEMTRYYLEREEERRDIAINGWKRYWKDFHATAIWQRIGTQLEEWLPDRKIKERKDINSSTRNTVIDIVSSYMNLDKNIAKPFLIGKEALPELWKKYKSGAKSIPDERAYLEEKVSVYTENPEMKGVNLAKERLTRGEPFEWPNMLALNWAATSLIKKAKKIIEIGSGTGPFAHFASIDSSRTIHCFEEDDFARTWAEQNRSHPNVKYNKNMNDTILETYDLLVAIDVIEHVEDMNHFLSLCSNLSERAIFSTPNRNVVRGPGDMGPPPYPPHVREFNTGELYWILRQYYKEISLYHMPDVYVPWIEPMNLLTKGTPIIAECNGSYQCKNGK